MAKIISLNLNNIQFSDTEIGQMSLLQLLSITATDELLNINDLIFPVGFKGRFTSVGGMYSSVISGFVVPAGGTIDIDVVFNPFNLETYSDDLNIDSDATIGDNTVHLSGVGIPVINKIKEFPNVIEFGKHLLDTVSCNNFTLENNTSGVVTVKLTAPDGFWFEDPLQGNIKVKNLTVVLGEDGDFLITNDDEYVLLFDDDKISIEGYKPTD